MSSTAQKIEVVFFNVQNKILPPALMRQVAQAQAAASLDMARKRTMMGLDISGNKFKPLTKKYSVWKSKVIAGTIKPKGLGNKTMYAAGASSDIMRLKGQMLAAMIFTNVTSGRQDKSFWTKWQLTLRGAKQLLKAQGLAERGRTFLGMARPGTSERRKEDKVLIDIAKTTLRLNASAKGYVLTDG